jgi:hypothetical protein
MTQGELLDWDPGGGNSVAGTPLQKQRQ